MIETIPQKQLKSNLAACTEILADLVLEKQIIVSTLVIVCSNLLNLTCLRGRILLALSKIGEQ